MYILISGLPRAGKTTIADALAAVGYTHVPLDRYIRRMPEGVSFLEWVSSPACIDWDLLSHHLSALQQGQVVEAPADWGPTWAEGGLSYTDGGNGRRRVMHPSTKGYVVPGCYSFHVQADEREVLRVFVSAPRATIAERIVGAVSVDSAEGILDVHLSQNWRDIESYADQAELVLSGLDSPEALAGPIIEHHRP